MKQTLIKFYLNVKQFVTKHLLAICLITISIVLFVFVINKPLTKSVTNLLQNDNSKYESNLKELKDSLNIIYFRAEFKKDSLTNLIKVLQNENKVLSLQTSLLKFKQSKIKVDEKNIKYNDKNVSIDSALNTIKRIVTKYPLKQLSNR
jgi:predicted PurR-regulated permease PerM